MDVDVIKMRICNNETGISILDLLPSKPTLEEWGAGGEEWRCVCLYNWAKRNEKRMWEHTTIPSGELLPKTQTQD